MFILYILLIVIFMLLSMLHFSWAIGGTWGFESALPTNESGVKILIPRKLDCALVGIGLLALAAFYLSKSGFIVFNFPYWLTISVSWIIPSIFIFRAIGDFKYVGFFKKVKHTKFSKLDTRYFSPLCLLIGLTGILIEIL